MRGLPMRGLPIRGLLADEFVPERLRKTRPRPQPELMLGLMCGFEPKPSMDMRGDLPEDTLRAGDAEAELFLIELVPSDGDLKRKRCMKVGVACCVGRHCSYSASAMRRNWASLMARRSKFSKAGILLVGLVGWCFVCCWLCVVTRKDWCVTCNENDVVETVAK